MDLAALEEIKRVKYQYLRGMDLKRWDELADALAPEATATYGTAAYGAPIELTGRAAIVGFLREKLSGGVITMHVASHPDIRISEGGDTAEATWAFEDTVIAPEHQVVIRGAAYYEDRYRRDGDGRWLLTHTGYQRIYEAMLSLKDLPSFQLISNRWAAPAG